MVAVAAVLVEVGQAVHDPNPSVGLYQPTAHAVHAFALTPP